MNGFETAAWTQIWQVTAVAAVVFISVRVFAKNRPHLAHVLWALVLIKCITPPIFSSHISPFSWLAAEVSTAQVESSIPLEFTVETYSDREPDNGISVSAPGFHLLRSGGDKSIGSTSNSPNNIATSTQPTEISWQREVAFVWLFGVVVCLLWQTCRLMSLCILVRRKQQRVPVQIEAIVAGLSSRLGLKRNVKPLLTSASIGPAVFGLLRPKILLPLAIVNSRPIKELEPLIAHELIHIRRGDLWWALLQTVAGALFWFHPLVRLAVVGISRESERSCDEETVSSLGCLPSDYARCLLNVLEQKHRLRSAPALPGVKPIEITSARLERVMKLGHGSYKKTPWWTWVVLLACCALVLPGAALVFAQDAGEGKSLPAVDSAKPKVEEQIIKLYPLDDIIKLMGESNPRAEVQELELRLLRHLKDYPFSNRSDLKTPTPAQRGTRIQKGSLVAVRTAAEHDKLKTRINQIRKLGLRQIVIETRVVKCPKGSFADLGWQESKNDSFRVKRGVLHRTTAISGPVIQASFEVENTNLNGDVISARTLMDDFNAKDGVEHELRDAEQTSHTVRRVILDDDEVETLLERISKDDNLYGTEAPTVVMFDGQHGSIHDVAKRPFVTGVEVVKDGNGKVANQPLISILSDGTSMDLAAESVDASDVQLDAKVWFSKIVDVKTFTYNKTPSVPLTVQLPEFSGSVLKFDGTIGEKETLVVRATNPDDREEDLLFLVSTTLVDDAEVAVPPNEKLTATAHGRHGELRYNDQKFSTATVTQYVSPSAHVNVLNRRFDQLCFKNKVGASEKEIDALIASRANTLGVSEQRWMDIVTNARGLMPIQVRKIVSNEIKFGKLPDDDQRRIREGRLSIGVDANIEGIVIRSQDEERNWEVDKARIIEVSEERVVIRTDVEMSATQHGIKFAGKDLEVVSTDGEPYISADDVRLVMADEVEAIHLTGNARVNMGDGLIAADSIKYGIGPETMKLVLQGNASLTCDAAVLSADRIEQTDETMVLTGKVEVKLMTDSPREFKGQKIEIDDNGNLIVDGQDMGVMVF
jgi:beta-lactamase regulating signal transducer with metallopeptidase domain/lipopolysaccharide export system protein LptA